MSGQQIQKLRHKLGESTHMFAERFEMSGRTVEGWEQERFQPNKLVVRLMIQLAKEVRGQNGEV